jgi:glycogen debranching enzyme
MTVKISVGPPVLTINRSSTFMVTDYGGEIDPRQIQGVFADDTRFVSGYRLRIAGQPWQRVSSAAVAFHSARIYLTNPTLLGRPDGSAIPAGSVALRLLRSIDQGIQERFEITNYAPEQLRFVLEIELLSDFADIFELKDGAVREREDLVTQWDRRRAVLTTTYRRQDFLRRVSYQLVEAPERPTYANGRLRCTIELAPQQTWRARGEMLLQCDQAAGQARHRPDLTAVGSDLPGRLHERWLGGSTHLESPCEDVREAYRQAVEDIGALRLFEQDLGPDQWVPAAGVPWFVTVFGRDSLVTSLQSLIVNARFAEGTLRVLARHQAEVRDDWRDAQPGKIVHELRQGELAHFNLVPHTRYYGTWDATPLYLIALAASWRWLADRRLLEDLRPAAERCLEWIDRWGDLDGDGFQEYQTFSSQGYENMGWKDASDAVVYPDGRQVKQPKALCELQGYVYQAWGTMAEVYEALGEPGRAVELRERAAELKRRFNIAFWLEDEGTYAFGLDPDKQPIRTIASNAGHCLWSGIADPDKAPRVAARLLAPDMWSGWGIRTLSADNPAYNPFAYQRGSVWPHDNAIIAAGFKAYGLRAEANQVAQALSEAAARYSSYRLPELFAGLRRGPASFPVQYVGANVPQAWAAGSIFQLMQTMLGLRADAPNRCLTVDPSLPAWLPTLTLDNLAVGQTRLRLRFWRDGEESRWEVEEQRGPTIEVSGPDRSRDLGPLANPTS